MAAAKKGRLPEAPPSDPVKTKANAEIICCHICEGFWVYLFKVLLPAIPRRTRVMPGMRLMVVSPPVWTNLPVSVSAALLCLGLGA